MKNRTVLAAVAAIGVFASGSMAQSAGGDQCGGASWYSLPGNMTANGEIMDPDAMTAAHKTLPFGTRVKVTNRANGKTLVLRINDRGPYINGRIIDVSKAAAHRLGFLNAGHVPVCITKV